MKIKTVVCDEHFIAFEGIQAVLGRIDYCKFEVSTLSPHQEHLSSAIAKLHTQLLIINTEAAGFEAITQLQHLRQANPNLKILVYDAFFSAPQMELYRQAGANGCLLKRESVEVFQDAILALLQRGEYQGRAAAARPGHAAGWHQALNPAESGGLPEPLTKRELQILQLISQAFSNKQIANNLYISVQTVGVHRKNIMKKLGVSNTAGLVKAAFQYALLS